MAQIEDIIRKKGKDIYKGRILIRAEDIGEFTFKELEEYLRNNRDIVSVTIESQKTALECFLSEGKLCCWGCDKNKKWERSPEEIERLLEKKYPPYIM